MTGLHMKYFMLKPAGDDLYAVASRAATLAYANIIRSTNPVLAKELESWVIDEENNANEWKLEQKNLGL